MESISSLVHEDHKYEMCEVMLLKNSNNACFKISQGREQSRVIFNHYNGIALQIRQANNMRFEKDVTDGFCSELFKKYQVDE